jgi:hypothetical protein
MHELINQSKSAAQQASQVSEAHGRKPIIDFILNLQPDMA